MLDRHRHSWNSAGAKKVGVGNISRRAWYIVRYWHPLGCGAVELGQPPQEEGVIHRPSSCAYTRYTYLYYILYTSSIQYIYVYSLYLIPGIKLYLVYTRYMYVILVSCSLTHAASETNCHVPERLRLRWSTDRLHPA